MADPRMDWADAVMFGVEEDPVLRSVITLVILLDQEPNEKMVRERIERMTRLVPKLRQRAVGNPLSLAPPAGDRPQLRHGLPPAVGQRPES